MRALSYSSSTHSPKARLHQYWISAKYNIILINYPDYLPDLSKGGGMIFDTDSML